MWRNWDSSLCPDAQTKYILIQENRCSKPEHQVYELQLKVFGFPRELLFSKSLYHTVHMPTIKLLEPNWSVGKKEKPIYTFTVWSSEALAKILESTGLNATCCIVSECSCTNDCVQSQPLSQSQSFISRWADDNTYGWVGWTAIDVMKQSLAALKLLSFCILLS